MKTDDIRKNLGRRGEKISVQYLRDHGYKIIDQNYRTRYGEIDIVAREGDFFVFVEVKTRTNRLFGLPEEAIDARKQQKIAVTAEHYLATHHLYEKNYRIDSVAVEIDEKDGKTQIRHEKDVVGW